MDNFKVPQLWRIVSSSPHCWNKPVFKKDQNSQNQVKLVSWDGGDLEEPTDVLDRPWPCWNTLGDSGVVPAGLSRRL